MPSTTGEPTINPIEVSDGGDRRGVKRHMADFPADFADPAGYIE
jgi:hypothetical protein